MTCCMIYWTAGIALDGMAKKRRGRDAHHSVHICASLREHKLGEGSPDSVPHPASGCAISRHPLLGF